jgi:predicted 2-oxoglutarate/Fe(II)-dependent dioxygenase YbiX
MFDGERKGIPTLSVVGALNDDYEGGDFLMLDDEIVDIPAGSVLVFPSTFMYMHKVSPVTKGTRFSFVSWVW